MGGGAGVRRLTRPTRPAGHGAGDLAASLDVDTCAVAQHRAGGLGQHGAAALDGPADLRHGGLDDEAVAVRGR